MYRSRNNIDLAVVVAVAILTSLAIAAHLPGPLIVVLGIGLFAAPGYVWSGVLLSKRAAVLERVVVGIGLCMVVPGIGGVLIYAAGVHLFRGQWVGLLVTASLIGALVLFVQRRAVPEDEDDPRRQRPLKRQKLGTLHKFTFGVAGLLGAGALVLAVWSANAEQFPGYSPLWLTPVQADWKPATPDATTNAYLGVQNEQGQTEQYKLVLYRKGKVSDTWTFTLASGQTKQLTVLYNVSSSITADLYQLPNTKTPIDSVNNGE